MELKYLVFYIDDFRHSSYGTYGSLSSIYFQSRGMRLARLMETRARETRTIHEIWQKFCLCLFRDSTPLCRLLNILSWKDDNAQDSHFRSTVQVVRKFKG